MNDVHHTAQVEPRQLAALVLANIGRVMSGQLPAVQKALAAFLGGGHVLLEDNPGTGPGSVRKFTDVLKLQIESGAIVYGVGVGAKVDRVPLETLARASGGQAYFPMEASELGEQYLRILENLRRRFALSYASTNAKRDGAWRKVEIRTRSTNLTVSTAGGYFAPNK